MTRSRINVRTEQLANEAVERFKGKFGGNGGIIRLFKAGLQTDFAGFQHDLLKHQDIDDKISYIVVKIEFYKQKYAEAAEKLNKLMLLNDSDEKKKKILKSNLEGFKLEAYIDFFEKFLTFYQDGGDANDKGSEWRH